MGKRNIDDIKTKLLELNNFIKPLCPEIRSSAFDILAPLYFDGLPRGQELQRPPDKQEPPGPQFGSTGAIEELIKQFDHKKPKNNVFLIVAWLYSQHGVFPITAKQITKLGANTGLITPGRPDNTMRTAKQNGKNLFTQHDKGWKLTVSGESYMKQIYGVKKGQKPLEE